MEGLDQTVTAHAPAREHWVAVSVLRQYEGLPAKYGGLNPTKQPDLPVSRFAGPGQLPDDATPEQKAAFEARKKAIAANGGGFGRRNRPPQITDVSFRVNFVEIPGPFKPKTDPMAERPARAYGEIGIPDPHHPLTHHQGKKDWIEKVTGSTSITRRTSPISSTS